MRAQAEGKGEASARRELEHALLVGSDVVFLRGDYLQVGQVAFRITEVREYALRGANLPLTGGRLLQAAMGLLVVAAEERAAPARTSPCCRSGSPTTRRGRVTPPAAEVAPGIHLPAAEVGGRSSGRGCRGPVRVQERHVACRVRCA